MRAPIPARGRSVRRFGLVAALAPAALATIPFFASPDAHASPASSGATIVGKITNSETKEPLANAIVILECTCLQSARETTTDAQGLYRFADLPAGTYSVNVFAGKGKVYKVIEVARGEAMRVSSTIDPNNTEVREIVVVTGGRVPQRGDSGITLGGEELSKLNVGHNPDRNPVTTAVLTTSTGGADAAGPTTGGADGGSMNYTLNGMRTNSVGFGTMALPLVNEFVQSVEVREATYSAEFGSASGGQVAVRRLAGSNKMRGTARFTYTPRLAEPRVITGTDNAVRAQDAFDYGVQGVVAVSGPILRDRLFWSGGLAFLGTKSTLSQTFWHRVDKDGSGGFEDCPHENGDNDCADGKNFIATERFAEQRFPTRSLGARAFAGLDWVINPKHRLELTGAVTPGFIRRSYRRPLTSFDPDSLGASPTADPLGGASTVANGIVNDTFGWDRSNEASVSLQYQGRVADDKVEIDGTIGFMQSAFDEAWKLDDPSLYRKPATQEQDGQGANLFEFLDRDGALPRVPGTKEACNDPDLPGLSCPTRAWLSGGLGQYARDRGRRVQGDLALTHLFSTEKAGSHQLKYGTQLEWLSRRRTLRYSGDNQSDFTDNCGPGQVGGGEWCFDPETESYALGQAGRVDNHRMIFADTDNPDLRQSIGFGRVQHETGQLRAIADPLGNGARVSAYDATVSSTNVGAFVQDRWAILDNLFLDVGVRWEGQDMRDVLGRRAVGIWDNVAPRASLVYDLTGEGRSRLFASYGWFFQQLPLSMLNRVYGGLVNVTRTYRNSECQGQEVEFRGREEPLTADRQPTEFCVDFGRDTTGLTEGAAVPRLRGQYDQALQIGYEHEVVEDLTVGVKWLHRDLARAVEDVSTNGGLDFILANPGLGVDPAEIESQRAHCDDLTTRLESATPGGSDHADLGRQLQRCEFLADAFENVGRIYDRPTRTFDAFSLEVRKRLAKHWLFIGSYTYSRLVGNYEGFVDPVSGAINLGSSTQFNMPELVRNSFGPLPYDTPHRLALDGYYTFDLSEAGQLTLGGSLRVRSGYPISMRAGHTRVPGGFPIHVIPRGSAGRVEPNYQLNASLQYAYPLGRGLVKDPESPAQDMALAVGLRFFNVTNAKAALRVDEVYSYQNARPIAGGEMSDLKHAKIIDSANPTEHFQRRVLEPQGNFGVESTFQLPLSAQVDVMLLF
jgi:hypothetical protein